MYVRRTVRVVALLVALAAVVLARTPQDAVGDTAATPDPPPAATTALSAAALAVPVRSGLTAAEGELFSASPASAPATAPVLIAPTRAAAPPPVPYRFAGTLIVGTERQIFLAKGDRIFPVIPGEILDGQYRVETITDERIDLIYLPLGSTDRIVLASAPSSVASIARSEPMDERLVELHWEGPARVDAGANFNVALRLNTKQLLQAAPMQLRYEPGVLEPVSVQPGKFFRDGTFSYKLLSGGSIFIGASTTAAPAAEAELIILTLKPLKRGATAEVSISALNLQTGGGRVIAHNEVPKFQAAIR